MAKSKTSSKAGKSRTTKKRGSRKPGTFQPNNPETGFIDSRINRSGQNRKFTEFHRMIVRVGDEKTTVNRKEMDRFEKMIREMFESGEAAKQKILIEYAVGKVPDELKVDAESEMLIRMNLSILTDGQLDRLQSGDSKPADILIELLAELRTLRDES